MSDQVYEQHKAKINGDRQDSPRHEQGHYIEAIKAYARCQIEEKDATRARCMTLKSAERVCHYIGIQEGELLPTKVYGGLRVIGYGKRYHDMKTGNPDELHGMVGCISDCFDTCDIDLIDKIDDGALFRDTISKTFRVDSKSAGEAAKEAQECGIHQSELTLYNVLTGIEILLSEEPHYIDRIDERLFRIPMDELISARRKIGMNLVSLRSILATR